MFATYIKGDHTQYELCNWCVFKGYNLHVFGRLSVGFVENFNTGIFSDIISGCNKCQTLCDGTMHWALTVHYIFSDLDIFQGDSSVSFN